MLRCTYAWILETQPESKTSPLFGEANKKIRKFVCLRERETERAKHRRRQKKSSLQRQRKMKISLMVWNASKLVNTKYARRWAIILKIVVICSSKRLSRCKSFVEKDICTFAIFHCCNESINYRRL